MQVGVGDEGKIPVFLFPAFNLEPAGGVNRKQEIRFRRASGQYPPAR